MNRTSVHIPNIGHTYLALDYDYTLHMECLYLFTTNGGSLISDVIKFLKDNNIPFNTTIHNCISNNSSKIYLFTHVFNDIIYEYLYSKEHLKDSAFIGITATEVILLAIYYNIFPNSNELLYDLYRTLTV